MHHPPPTSPQQSPSTPIRAFDPEPVLLRIGAERGLNAFLAALEMEDARAAHYGTVPPFTADPSGVFTLRHLIRPVINNIRISKTVGSALVQQPRMRLMWP